MPKQPSKKTALLFPAAASRGVARESKTLPPVLLSLSSRSASGAPEPLVDVVEVVESYPLASVSRGDTSTLKRRDVPEDERLLALEAADGSTVFIHADRLKETLRRLYPDEAGDDEVNLALLRDREGATRGFGDWVWKRLSVLTLKPDSIAEAAREQAMEWVGEKLAGQLVEKFGKGAVFSASALGAKALMEAIESQLAGAEGVYQWRGGVLSRGDLCRAGDVRLSGWGDAPALIFIHGTGSNTSGSFGDLRSSRDWEAIEHIFGDRVFGFEHRTFSRSPIDNALTLAEVLPAGARISFVTHSRGGLVGDLLCLGSFTQAARKLITDYRRSPRPDEEEAEKDDKSGELKRQREEIAAEEQAKLTRLVELLGKKNLRIERYVRVACPAAGTALLSDNFEVFLSGLLTLVRKLGAWGTGAAVGAIATPVAGQVAKQAADEVLKVLSRVVLEIADKRLRPEFVPGIEAMLTDAPMGAFLGRAPRRTGVRMGVIAGDIEGGGILQRIGVMFTDWMFFDREDNDLVVDTDSMYAGLAIGNEAHALFDQGSDVNHFSYFRNPRTREALREWLLRDDPLTLPGWTRVAPPGEAAAKISRGRREVPPDNSQPVVIYVPGIMGSNLEVARKIVTQPGSGDRVWLDFVDLPLGGLGRIARGVNAWPDDVVDLAYGRLAVHLEATHRVIRFPYDWRAPWADAAGEMEKVLKSALETHPDQPVRILAHSMGGLVTRTLFARKPALWEKVVARPGGRLLMLGTPNHGSHLMVETLLGKSNTIRTLGRIDLRHSLQEVLDIISAYVGALGLLPEPGFNDVGGPAARDYFARASWEELASFNNDFWFGKKLGGRPAKDDLRTATDQWTMLAKAKLPHPERIAYVFGQGKNTPCGIAIRKNSKGQPVGIEMLGTLHGDGSVTWESGKWKDVIEDRRCWFMPADHGGLVNKPEYFNDIVELLNTGSSSRLGRLPVSRGVAAPVRHYNAGPPPGFVGEQELVMRLIGGGAEAPRPSAKESVLAVSVRAMDLRFAQQPVMCGHYIGDPIAGAESVIDYHLVEGALRQRERLGVYAADIGTAAVVLMPRSEEEQLRGTGRGALVVGLGEFGKLSSEKVAETVRAGVLRLLLHTRDFASGTAKGARKEGGPIEVKLSSVLLGFNSTTNISIDESVAAVVRGVCEANRQFGDGAGSDGAGTQIAALEFIEIYQDAAITAARAVAALPQTLAKEMKRLVTRLEPAKELCSDKGMRPRLSLSTSAGYWPRLIITDADRGEEECPASCFEARVVSPVPPEALSRLMTLHGFRPPEAGEDGRDAAAATAPLAPRCAERLKFVFLSERARAEAVVQQRQPGLIESLIATEVTSIHYNRELAIGRTLFHLLVPLDFKAAASEARNLLLVLDGYTANFPWEMLEVDGEPLVLKTRLVRQLMSTRFRRAVRSTREPAAYVVANPSTAGYHAQFGGTGWKPALDKDGKPEEDRLSPLPSAEHEADAVRAILERVGYDVTFSPGGSEANDVVGKLFKRPFRVLVIAAHGVFQVTARDGSVRSGVVLSGGVLLTAAEVGQMEVVPELVYLSCCNLGKAQVTAGAAPNRLAYSLARELIEMGVRCVVAAGWEVEDNAASTFATTFFERFVNAGQSFGDAIFAARVETHEAHRSVNTWGAYQAYGDPSFKFGDARYSGGDDRPLLAPEELLDWLAMVKLNATHSRKADENDEQRLAKVKALIDGRLRDVPAGWRDRPDVQQALGALLAEYGEAGFDAAREAYLRAIAEDSRTGVVPLTTIEQLANLEARTGGTLAESKGGRSVERRKKVEGLARVDCAIARLRDLIRITSADPRPGRSAAPARINAERWCVLGSAYKRRAALLAHGKVPWKKIREALEHARDAYLHGETSPDKPACDPYPMINRLQLDALLGGFKGDETAARIELASRCADCARARFAKSFKFFDAIMPVDAQVAMHLLGGTLPASKDLLVQAYTEAFEKVPRSAREFDSVVKQLRLLALFFKLGAGEADHDRARVIEAVADEVGRIATAAASPGEADRPKDSPAARPDKGTRGAGAKPPKRARAAKGHTRKPR